AVLAVLAVLGWDRFFTGFHALFFEQGTWQFYLDDALIRLFPAQFWMDAGIAVGAIILLASLLLLLLSFIGAGSRRARRPRGARLGPVLHRLPRAVLRAGDVAVLPR
ncbi:DUF1461 domain-containing protein, partial [Staphylococcus aureus]